MNEHLGFILIATIPFFAIKAYEIILLKASNMSEKNEARKRNIKSERILNVEKNEGTYSTKGDLSRTNANS